MYRATHNSSPAEIPTAGPTWNSHYNTYKGALKITSYRTKVYKVIHKGKQNKMKGIYFFVPGLA